MLPDRQSCTACPGSRITLTPPTLDAGYPRAAPTGHAILFSQSLHASQAHRPGAGPLWLLAGQNGPARPLTHHPAGTWSYEGNWSPDGTQIVYLYYRPGWNHNQLRIVNADGSGDHALWAAPAGTYAAVPDWGP